MYVAVSDVELCIKQKIAYQRDGNAEQRPQQCQQHPKDVHVRASKVREVLRGGSVGQNVEQARGHAIHDHCAEGELQQAAQTRVASTDQPPDRAEAERVAGDTDAEPHGSRGDWRSCLERGASEGGIQEVLGPG